MEMTDFQDNMICGRKVAAVISLSYSVLKEVSCWKVLDSILLI